MVMFAFFPNRDQSSPTGGLICAIPSLPYRLRDDILKAILIDDCGDSDCLRLSDAPDPVLGPGEVLVRVAAVAVNPADWKWRAGMFGARELFRFPHIPGYDLSGTVIDGGLLPAGTRVAAMLDAVGQGAYAQYVACPVDRLAVLPETLDFQRAAAIPTAGLIGAQLIEESLDVQPGMRVLITGATGAVGRFAVHAAKARGAIVVGAVRESARPTALSLGVDEVIGFDGEAEPIDMVADTVGGTGTAALLRRIACKAKIHTVATDPVPAEGLLKPPRFFAVHPDASRLEALARAVAEGIIPVPIARALPFSDASLAHRLGESGGIEGKLILIPPELSD
ncbi:MAG: NADP-dependent oxidoreductase [Sphingomonadales bacterium]